MSSLQHSVSLPPAMLGLGNVTGIMAARNDNSPDPQRRKRPLSIIEENGDEDQGSQESAAQQAKVTKVEESSQQACQSQESTDSRPKEKAKRTRRVGVFNQQPPALFLHQSEPLNHPSDACSGGTENVIEQTGVGTEGDLTRLKDTATKLNLKTRRQSYLAWRAKYVDKPRDVGEVKVVSATDGKLTSERKAKMDSDLKWIKEQLVDLRRQDQSLARQLLGIRHELSNLRLAVSCEEHRDLLEDAQEEIEDLRELSRFADLPSDMLGYSPLRHIGVTKMNLSSRRFSTC